MGTMAIIFPALFDPRTGEFTPIETPFLVGRSEGADLVVNNKTVSREQFSIETVDGQLAVRPLSHSTPTLINEEEVEDDGLFIEHGDVISFGNASYVFLTKYSKLFTSKVYPAIYIPKLDVTFALTSGVQKVGRSSASNIKIKDDPACSRTQMELSVNVNPGNTKLSVFAANISENTPTYLNGEQLESRVLLRHGDVISFGTTSMFYIEDQCGISTNIDRDPATKIYHRASAATPSGDQLDKEIAIFDGIKMGRDSSNGLTLDHPSVSRFHAEIVRVGGVYLIRDLKSLNGTFVNDSCVTESPLQSGDKIDIGPYSLQLTGNTLIKYSRTGNARVVAKNLSRTVKTATGPVRILDDISLVINPGDFVCILGPSGCGKSTLMNALSGRQMADQGGVWINDVSLYKHFEILKEDIAHVPQHDVLHEELSVRKALQYTARLRFPHDTPSTKLCGDIEQAIASVDLSDIADNQINGYSGGQKKRASLANEILCRPGLLFLDEVTSGLDEKTDWEMMQLCRKMADDGMTVVCITHTLANVEEFCTKVVILLKGGYLAFYGTPAEAMKYFGISRLGEAYNILERKSLITWVSEFSGSNLAKIHITEPLEANDPSIAPSLRTISGDKKSNRDLLSELFWQFRILTERCTELMLSDKKSLLIAIGQAVVIGILLKIVFETLPSFVEETKLVFFMGICGIWFGCNNSAKEIVKERPIYKRERDINLQVAPYVLSKLIVYGLLAVVQALVLCLVVIALIGIPGNDLAQIGVVMASALVGTSLGLLISAAVNTRDQANTLVPLALIPQIVLSGAIVEKMPSFAEFLAKTLISGYWSFKIMTDIIQDTGTYWTSGILALHASLYMIVACIVMIQRDKRA